MLLTGMLIYWSMLFAQQQFSFIYNNISSATLLPGWNYSATTKTDAYGTWNIDIYSDPVTQLEVRCEKRIYTDFGATEWVVYFENKSNQTTPLLSNIEVANYMLQSNTAGSFNVYYNKGSQITDSDYQPVQRTITSSLTLSPFEGRPSAWNALPFFNIQQPDGNGDIIGIGWAGQWQVNFTKGNDTSGKLLQIIAGMQLTSLKLLPGEIIRTPSILSMPYTTDLTTAQNKFRQLLLKHYTPKQNGQTITDYPQCASPYSNPINQSIITQSDMSSFLQTLTTYNHPKNAYVWLDAGWYNCSANWENTGTWQTDLSRFPNGLSAVADSIHKYNYKFMVWFEPERITPNTWLYINKPQWLLPIASGHTLVTNEGLLNLGDTGALSWAKNTFISFLKTNKIDIYRQDFNTNPLTAWQNNDASDRQGITEIKYVMGLYNFWDSLRTAIPDLLIDNCASGGMRYDLELIKRSFSFWRDDDCWKSDVEQCYTYGLATWFPVGGRGSVTIDPYDWQSGMGAIFSSFPENNNATKDNYISAHLPQYKQLRNLYTGDFYPLTNYTLADNVWMAWQFNVPDSNSGVLQAFRRQNSTINSMTFKLKGLNAGMNYILRNIDTGDSSIISGSNLMNTGFPIALGNRKSILLKYTATQQTLPVYAVNFHIVNSQTQILRGATIIIAGDTLTTDASGNASISLSNYGYIYTIKDAGYITLADSLTVNDSAFSITKTLTQAATITFLIDATETPSATAFYLKGSWITNTGIYDNSWDGGAEHASFYDDGTHGDAIAGDHIFTTQLQLIPDGGTNTWQWGFNDASHNWVTGNFNFKVTSNAAQILSYQLPGINTFPCSFTITDNSGTAIQQAKITIGSSNLFTNISGNSIFNLTNGSHNYSINASGYDTATGTAVITGAAKSIAVTLQPQTLFIFIGNGNWSDSSNWLNNSLPPASLPAGYEIDISPSQGGVCILDTPQTIAPSGILVIEPNAQFTIEGNLVISH